MPSGHELPEVYQPRSSSCPFPLMRDFNRTLDPDLKPRNHDISVGAANPTTGSPSETGSKKLTNMKPILEDRGHLAPLRERSQHVFAVRSAVSHLVCRSFRGSQRTHKATNRSENTAVVVAAAARSSMQGPLAARAPPAVTPTQAPPPPSPTSSTVHPGISIAQLFAPPPLVLSEPEHNGASASASSASFSSSAASSLEPAASPAAAKPFMLLLPDLDGSGMTSARTRPALAAVFELHALHLLPEHSGSFAELTEFVSVREQGLVGEWLGRLPLQPEPRAQRILHRARRIHVGERVGLDE